jgi:asparagine synthase (glutamine-hydrolysing)
MCGLAGFIAASPQRSSELCAIVRRMADCLTHRGPDDSGAWVDESAGVALGFRRLAIIDLSEAGHQPFISRDGQLALVFNGEIYNHAELRKQVAQDTGRTDWLGHSDTETLLACFAAWGVRKTLERTVGMFAIALWDRETRRLYLARDRFGEKPLYYGWAHGAFVFGSELKALRRYPAFDNSIDPDVLGLYMQYAYVPAPYSIYRHIYKLEPGCFLSLSPETAAAAPAPPLFAPSHQRGLELDRYWSLSDVARRGIADPLTDAGDATRRLEQALTDAVRMQSIADVPLGAFLSGGIDSSLIVALMQSQSARRVRTFTIGFDEAGFNEAEDAKAVARHLGTDHTDLYVTAKQALETIPKLPHLYSEPFADSSQIPTHLVSQMARQHVTVALSGDGGDELFGGYLRYPWAPRVWNRIKWLPPNVRRGLGAVIQRVPVPAWDAVGTVLPGRRFVRLGEKAHKLAHRLKRMNTDVDLYRTIVTTWPADVAVVHGARSVRTCLDAALGSLGAVTDLEQRMMLWDALTYLPDDILHKVDRASMGVSLETRAPYLDHRVAELAWRLPLSMKIRNGERKWILRQLLYRSVPKSLVNRPKMGFSVPIGQWIRGPLRDWAEHLLSDVALRSPEYFNVTLVREKWSEHLAGTRDWHNELWPVLMFQAWRDAER